MDAPSLQAFKARLDVALGLVVGDPAQHSRGLELDEHCGPFQPRPFYDSRPWSVAVNCTGGRRAPTDGVEYDSETKDNHFLT